MRSWRRDAAIALGCGALGFAAVAGIRIARDGGGDAARTNPRVALSDLAEARDRSREVIFDTVEGELPGPPAPTPHTAVDTFLRAETIRDYDASFGLLSAADRADVGSHAEWELVHGELPTLSGFELGATRVDGSRAEVDSRVTYEATLDETRGLVPARARATWVAVQEDGGWRVAHAESSLEPEYLDEQGAVQAAEQWVSARRACQARGEYAGGLVGSRRPVDALCRAKGRAKGPVLTGAVGRLDPAAGVEPFLAAFGPEVLSWARVVPVTDPAPLAVVLAPVGEQWLVVGALESSPEGSS